jgi:hypothetical protein
MKNFGISIFVVLAVAFVLYAVGHGNFVMAGLFVAALIFCRVLTLRRKLIYFVLFAQFAGVALPVSFLRTMPVAIFVQMVYIVGEILHRSVGGKRLQWKKSDLYLLVFILFIPVIAGVRGFGIYGLGGSSIGGMDYINMIVLLLFMLISSAAVRDGLFDVEKGFRYMLIGAMVSASASLLVSLFPDSYRVVTQFIILPQTEVSEEGVGRMSAVGLLACMLMPYVMTRPAFKWRVVLALGCFALAGISGFRTWLVIVGVLYVSAEIYMYRLTVEKVCAGLILGLVLYGVIWIACPSLDMRIQRSLSVVPGFGGRVEVAASKAATESSEWRHEVYKLCVKNAPKYSIVGRGLGQSLSGALVFLESTRRDIQFAIYHYEAHSYHLAIFTLLIDYGSLATLFFIASISVNIRKAWRFRTRLNCDLYQKYAGVYLLVMAGTLLTIWSGFGGNPLYLLMSSFILLNAAEYSGVKSQPSVLRPESKGWRR